jgi:hypothetical protein
MQAEALIVHPSRVLISGKGKSGKTTAAVDLIDRVLRHQIDRLIVICPSWSFQEVFDPIRDMVKAERDVFETEKIENSSENPFTIIFRQIRTCKMNAIKKGVKQLNICLLVDDMSGTSMMHGGRLTPLSNMAIQARHWNLSMIVLTQQPMSITPGYRDNVDAVIAFPPLRQQDRMWLFNEYNANGLRKDKFMSMVMKAWRGNDVDDDSEYGSHFLFILLPVRSKARYFIDYQYELQTNM